MSALKTKQEAVGWYIKNRPLYKQLAFKVEATLKEIIEIEKIPHHAIYSRAKEVESYSNKSKNGLVCFTTCSSYADRERTYYAQRSS